MWWEKEWIRVIIRRNNCITYNGLGQHEYTNKVYYGSPDEQLKYFEYTSIVWY